MDNMHFFKSFRFIVISHKRYVHTDNSRGIEKHYIARLRCGSGRIVTLDGDTLELRENDVFYLPLGLKYNSYWTPCEKCGKVEWESLGFALFPDPSGKEYPQQIITTTSENEKLLDRIADNMTVSASSIGLLYSFIGGILPKMRETKHDPRSAMLARASDYIAANPDFRVPDLARHCGMSESGLYAFFRAFANTSPIEMKNKIQTEKAVELLGSTDLSVEEISDRLGFSSVAYFRKIVKKFTGKTPTDIRKEQFAKYNL